MVTSARCFRAGLCFAGAEAGYLLPDIRPDIKSWISGRIYLTKLNTDQIWIRISNTAPSSAKLWYLQPEPTVTGSAYSLVTNLKTSLMEFFD